MSVSIVTPKHSGIKVQNGDFMISAIQNAAMEGKICCKQSIFKAYKTKTRREDCGGMANLVNYDTRDDVPCRVQSRVQIAGIAHYHCFLLRLAVLQ